MTSTFSLQNSVAFALLHFVLQCQIYLFLQVSLDFLLFITVPYDEKGIFLCVCVCVLVLEGLVSLHRAIQLQDLWHQWLGHRLEFFIIIQVWWGQQINKIIAIENVVCSLQLPGEGDISHHAGPHQSWSVSRSNRENTGARAFFVVFKERQGQAR